MRMAELPEKIWVEKKRTKSIDVCFVWLLATEEDGGWNLNEEPFVRLRFNPENDERTSPFISDSNGRCCNRFSFLLHRCPSYILETRGSKVSMCVRPSWHTQCTKSRRITEQTAIAKLSLPDQFEMWMRFSFLFSLSMASFQTANWYWILQIATERITPGLARATDSSWLGPNSIRCHSSAIWHSLQPHRRTRHNYSR